MPQIEIMISENGIDIRRIPNPCYLQKLKLIEKEDIRIHFKNIDDFDKHLDIM